VGKAEPAPEWAAKFAGKQGWLGGDGLFSAALGPRRVLWLFGDTILGKVQGGRRARAVMVNNTIGLQSGRGAEAAIRFVAGRGKDGNPAAVFTPAGGKGWLWPQAAVRVGRRLFVFLAQIDRAKGSGPFAFRHIGLWLAVVQNPDDDPPDWRLRQHQLPFARFRPGHTQSWGAAVLRDGGQVYVYGYDERRGKGVLGQRRLTVARVPADKLDDFAAWRFFTGKGWGNEAAEAAMLADGLATEFSVSRVPGGKGLVAVYTENGLGDRIVGRFAKAPEGPWSAPVFLYRCPEMAKDRGVFCYAAKAHPWAAGRNGLLVSYCVNAWDFGRLFRDEKVYRPKFVWIRMRPAR
jgi:hypothetical protein